MATASEREVRETTMVQSESEHISDDAVSAGGGHDEGVVRMDPQEANATGSLPQHTQLSTSMREKERKIGHRRVDNSGVVTYKKKPTSELMAAIQLGIGQSIGGLSSKPERDVLMQDFAVVESVFFPGEGSNMTPAHHYSDYRFKTYAPVAFRYFRELFGIQADDFMLSLCDEPMNELSNPGASGSIFYITLDDEFIIKTVQHKEAEFLQKLLPGYFLNLSQNPRTLLPKFYGLYCYQCGGKNIRFIVMNNLLPSAIKMHEKYDLKGSTYKRKASKHERAKSSPTLKDLDFLENNPDGLLLEKETLDALLKTLQRDVRVLESFKIMDYSLLVGIHNLDQSSREKGQFRMSSESSDVSMTRSPDIQQTEGTEIQTPSSKGLSRALSRGKSFKTRLAQFSTALESIQADTDTVDMEDEDVPPGGIPARNNKGERILLYLGIIDILQSYRLKKKLEHTMKSIVTDGDTISVHRPSYYAQRFLNFFSHRVFRKQTTALKHSPSKKKTGPGRLRSQTTIPEEPSESPKISDRRIPERSQRTISFSDEQVPAPAAVGGKPDLLPENTPPPQPPDRYSASSPSQPSHTGFGRTEIKVHNVSSAAQRGGAGDGRRSDLMTTAFHGDDGITAKQLTSLRHSPPLSLSESTPTHTEHTEGTPSLTTSSPSCSSDVLDYNMHLEFGTSPTSLSPEQASVSPSKKASSSSTEASYSSALDTQDTPSNNAHAGSSMQVPEEKDEITHL